MSEIIEFLKTITPKTDEEMIDEIKIYIEETENLTIKDLKKKLNEISQPYNFKEITEELLKKFGVIYKIPDIKKLINVVELLPN